MTETEYDRMQRQISSFQNMLDTIAGQINAMNDALKEEHTRRMEATKFVPVQTDVYDKDPTASSRVRIGHVLQITPNQFVPYYSHYVDPAAELELAGSLVNAERLIRACYFEERTNKVLQFGVSRFEQELHLLQDMDNKQVVSDELYERHAERRKMLSDLLTHQYMFREGYTNE